MSKTPFLWPLILLLAVSFIFLHNLAGGQTDVVPTIAVAIVMSLNCVIFSVMLLRILDFESTDLNENTVRLSQVRYAVVFCGLMYGIATLLTGLHVKHGSTIIIVSALLLSVIFFFISEKKPSPKNDADENRLRTRVMTKMLGEDFTTAPRQMFNRQYRVPALVIVFEYIAFAILFVIGKIETIDHLENYFPLTFPLLFGFCFCWIAIEWRRIKQLAAVTLPPIWLVFVFCAIGIGCFHSPQGQDTLWVMANNPVDIVFFAFTLLVFVAFATVSFNAPFRMNGIKHNTPVDFKFHLILTVSVIIYTVFMLVFEVLRANDLFFDGTMRSSVLSITWVVLMVAFTIMVICGIVLINPPYDTPLRKNGAGYFLYRAFIFLPDLFFPNGYSDAGFDGVGNRKTLGALFLKIMAITWIASFVIFTIDNGFFTTWLGAYKILFIALCAWTGISGVIQTLTITHYEKKDRPIEVLKALVIPALILSCLVFSPWRNNHRIRMTTSPSYNGERLAMNEICQLYSARIPGASGRRMPVVVAAEGGGLRSAFWTGRLLGKLCDTFPAFRENLIAISGVSGGTLGTNVFAAVIKNIPFDSVSGTPPQCTGKIDSVLSNDFLSPVIGKLLFPEMIQSFMPFNIPWFSSVSDRAKALEHSWENAYSTVIPEGLTIDRGFLYTQIQHPLPALFINTTWSETGERGIVSAVRLNKTMSFDCIDTIFTPSRSTSNGNCAGNDLPWSTAISLSARFPLVSPGGKTLKKDTLWGHLIDGGYFDNTGLQTAIEIVKSLSIDSAHKPLIVLIRNDANDDKRTKPIVWYNTFTEILSGLLKVRDARAKSDSGFVKFFASDFDVIEFNMDLKQKDVPLGWFLSDAARQDVRDYISRSILTSNNQSFRELERRYSR